MTMTIEIEGLTLWLGGRTILAKVDLAFASGELVAVLGASGAGKSTLGRLVTGGLRPVPGDAARARRHPAVARGTVRVGGRAVADWPQTALARRVGSVAQRPVALPGTVADNLMGVQRLAGLGGTPQAQRRRAEEALALAGLDGLAFSQPASALSGGQLQRLTIARALQLGPRTLVLDEPTSALDDLAAARIVTTVTALRDRGLTVILITHDNRLARLADRVVVLGQPAADRAARVILDAGPDTAFDPAAPAEVRRTLDALDALIPPNAA